MGQLLNVVLCVTIACKVAYMHFEIFRALVINVASGARMYATFYDPQRVSAGVCFVCVLIAYERTL